MKNISHWSLRYVCSKIAGLIYQWREPGNPWLTRTANILLQDLLKPNDVGIEFGSGLSTGWFAKKIGSLTSVEHDKEWFARVSRSLQAANLGNVTYVLVAESVKGGELPGYLSVLGKIKKNSIDFVLVDGLFRDVCAFSSIEYLKSGGLLVVDNVNRYLPSASLSPNSRTMSDGPVSASWASFMNITSSWRYIWTTDGVSDTAIYIKP